MKVFGSSSTRGRRATNNKSSKDIEIRNTRVAARDDATAKSKAKGRSTSGKKISKGRRTFTIIGSVVLFAATAFMIVFFTPLWDILFRPDTNILQHPDIARPVFTPESPDNVGSDTPANEVPESDLVPITDVRSIDHFTFLILGIDGTANTDVIMTATFNVEDHTLEIVSIPRDTIVNVDWNVRKANSINAVMRNRSRNDENPDERAMEMTVDHFSNLLGYRVDFWATINMRAFINLVDAIGGVQFDVPVNLNWSDPTQNMNFSLSRGPQKVNGINALGLMRWRGYAAGDMQRINVQQDFLKALMVQMMSGVNAGNISTFIDTFLSHIRTNIPMNNLAWLGREFLEMDLEDISFHTMPGRNDSVAGGSYVSIVLDEWLEMLNTYLSPLHEPIRAEDVSILTRGPDRRLFVTDGNWIGSSSWGANSRGPAG